MVGNWRNTRAIPRHGGCRRFSAERYGITRSLGLCDRASRRSIRRPGFGRDGVLEEGQPFGRGRASIQRHGRTDQELSDCFDRPSSPLPKDCIEETERRKASGIPDDVAFTTKPKIGVAIVEAALDADAPCAWVLGGSVYGSDKSLRVMFEHHDKMFSPFVAKKDWLWATFAHTRRRISPLVYLPMNGGVCPLARDRRGHAFVTGAGFVCFVTAMGPLAVNPPLDCRSRTRRRRRLALDDRGMFSIGQGRDGARSLRGAFLACCLCWRSPFWPD
jgi:hypothetical protein